MDKWIKVSEKYPKIGQQIIHAYKISEENWWWCAGIVDSSDDGIFIDCGDDGEELEYSGYWVEIPRMPE